MQIFLAAGAALALVVSAAHTETWRTRLVLAPEKSLTNCGPAEGLKIYYYDLTLNGSTISARSSGGTETTAHATADGTFKADFKAFTGRYEFWGNINAREFYLRHIGSLCAWRLVPE